MVAVFENRVTHPLEQCSLFRESAGDVEHLDVKIFHFVSRFPDKVFTNDGVGTITAYNERSRCSCSIREGRYNAVVGIQGYRGQLLAILSSQS